MNTDEHGWISLLLIVIVIVIVISSPLLILILLVILISVGADRLRLRLRLRLRGPRVERRSSRATKEHPPPYPVRGGLFIERAAFGFCFCFSAARPDRAWTDGAAW